MPTTSDHPRTAGGTRWSYRGQVISAARPTVLRWALLAGLAFALIGMHNLVALCTASHDQSRMGAAPPHAALVIAQAMPADTDGCCSDHDPAVGQPDHPSGHDHDLMHLCLAVLTALATLIMVWLLWHSSHTTTRHRCPRPAGVRAGRGPPRAHLTGDLLSSLCVLRL